MRSRSRKNSSAICLGRRASASRTRPPNSRTPDASGSVTALSEFSIGVDSSSAPASVTALARKMSRSRHRVRCEPRLQSTLPTPVERRRTRPASETFASSNSRHCAASWPAVVRIAQRMRLSDERTRAPRRRRRQDRTPVTSVARRDARQTPAPSLVPSSPVCFGSSRRRRSRETHVS